MATIMYHKMYNEIEREAILAVRNSIKGGLFKEKDENKRILKLLELHRELCKIYNLKEIRVQLVPHWMAIGTYNPHDNVITIGKASLVTYLHEFYHYKAIMKGKINDEENARGWSISLYYLATPKLCTKAILTGKIIHQTMMDVEEIKDE